MKKILSIISACAALQAAFAATPTGFALEDVGETKGGGTKYLDAYAVLWKADDADAVKAAAKACLDAPAVSKQKDAARAAKFLKASRLAKADFDSAAVAVAGKLRILVFAMPKGSRLRAGMNVMVFEKSADGKYLWNASFNDPLLALLGTSDFANAREIKPSALSEKDAKTLEKLEAKKLPFLQFKNGALLSMDETDGVNETAEAKFYHNAQDVFYSWKLDEYGNFMTPASRAKFESQFKSMPEAERRATLGEYFKWGKKYRKIMDAGALKLVLFSRHKEGAAPYNDIAYLRKSADGKLAIERFGADKTPLDLFLSKYIYPNGRDYAAEIAKKY